MRFDKAIRRYFNEKRKRAMRRQKKMLRDWLIRDFDMDYEKAKQLADDLVDITHLTLFSVEYLFKKLKTK